MFKKFYKKLSAKVVIFDENREKQIFFEKYLPSNIKIYGGNDNTVYIHRNLKARNIIIRFAHNCSKSTCILEDSGDSAGLDIDVTFLTGMNGTKIWLGNGSKCYIGNDCRFSYEIMIRTTDGHTIVEKDTYNIINKQKNPMIIGDNCWIGLRSIINKNVQLPHDTIVGSGSVVTKKFEEPYCIIAGSPAKVIKTNVKHYRETIYDFEQCYLS